VLNLLKELFRANDKVVIAGGSGLYIDAVCNGIDDLPDPDKSLRQELQNSFEDAGIEPLRQQLKILDPVYYDEVDLQNPKRLMRAIEVCLLTGKKYSDLRLNKPEKRDFDIIKIGLNMPRKDLFSRIELRTEHMLEKGWLEEVKSVFSYKYLNSLNTVGYKELFKYLEGEWTLDFAVEKIKTNTRRYAKRQLTWFKRDSSITWFHPDYVEKIINYIRK
jgi:tRNA dimethylallyltransferase